MSGKIVSAEEFDSMPGGKIVSAEEFDKLTDTPKGDIFDMVTTEALPISEKDIIWDEPVKPAGIVWDDAKPDGVTWHDEKTSLVQQAKERFRRIYARPDGLVSGPTALPGFQDPQAQEFAKAVTQPIVRASIEAAGSAALLVGGLMHKQEHQDALFKFYDKTREITEQLHPGADAPFVGKFLDGVLSMVPYLMTGGPGAVSILANAAARGAEAVKQGVDPNTATGLAVKDLAITAAMMTPGAFKADSLVGGTIKGATVNVGLDIADKALEWGILTVADHKDIADRVKFFDPESLGMAAAMGAGFGLKDSAGNPIFPSWMKPVSRTEAAAEARYGKESVPASTGRADTAQMEVSKGKGLPGTGEAAGKVVSAEAFAAMPAVERRGQLSDDAVLREKLNALPVEAIHNMVLTDPVSSARSRLAYELLEKDNPAEFTGISDARGLGAVDKYLGHKAGDDFVQRVVEAHKEEGIPVYRASDKGDEFLTRWNGLTKEEAAVKLKAVNDRLRNGDLIVENPDGSKRYFTNLELYTALGRDYNEAGQILGERKRTSQPTGYIKGEFPRNLVEITEAEWLAKTRGKGKSASGAPENHTSEVTPFATQSTLKPRPAVSAEQPLSLREQAKKQFVERSAARAADPTEQPLSLREQAKKQFIERSAAPSEERPQGDIAAGGVAFGQDLPKYAAGNTSINLERIDTDYPVKYLINQVAEQFKGKIDKARRGEITHEETRKLAEDLGLTEKTLLSRRKGQAFNAEEATAARDILNTSAQRLVELQRKAVESGSDADLVNFRLALSRHAAIQAEVSGAATEAGRALSAHRILSKSIPQTEKNHKAMLDALGGREITEEISRAFSQVDITNVAEVNRFIRSFAKVKKSDMIFEAWINFLLSGPKTHIVNTVSNTLTYLTKAPETAITSAVDFIRSKMAGTPRERFFGEVGADFVGARAGLIDGARAALKSFREEMPEDALLKLEQAKYKAIPGKMGEVVRLPGRFLTAADEFYKSVNYASELYALAYRKAAKDGATGTDLSEKAADYVQDPSPEMIEAAHHEAQYRTFTQPYGKWGRVLERSRHIPGVRYLVPFMRTPTNIAKFALERTPMNFARILYKANQGEIKGAQISDELAKPILGSMIGAAVVLLAQDGLVTGGGPKSKNERDALYRAGWQPYSLKIGDRYFSYGRLEPVGSVFGMAADYAELINDTEDKELTDYAENIALSISKNLTSKTFMKGVSSALDAISDPRRYGESWIEGFAGSTVPSIVNTAAKMTDETIRNVHGPKEAMQSRIPYLSKALLPKRDLWGREVQITGNALERGFSPIAVSKESEDPADKEILRLGMTPGMPKPEHKGEKLSPIQYDAFLQQAGRQAHDNALSVIENPTYAELDDEGKTHILTQVIEDARDEAKAELFEQTIDEIIDSRIKARERRAEIWSFPETREGAMKRKLKRIRE